MTYHLVQVITVVDSTTAGGWGWLSSRSAWGLSIFVFVGLSFAVFSVAVFSVAVFSFAVFAVFVMVVVVVVVLFLGWGCTRCTRLRRCGRGRRCGRCAVYGRIS